ncbi:hypothetical protein DCC81_21725 [Chitinophaga parva]|uniref:VOC domain-containing protein n=1 Tax=Chitinophaga parva TaxID=2169414 RepID=A0A2T7BD53_9BACT|nr:VOC family protein [Chitinophaga parva]PUZ23028.1 hypothetical protein DCC81_21725 [Chitinophaga parva]
MKFNLNTIILFVHDVDKQAAFYIGAFQFEVVEEIKSEWVLLKSGSCKIGLHKIGPSYQRKQTETVQSESNTKIVFEVDEEITKARDWLISKGALMKEPRSFVNDGQLFCDGEDPEGNIFQLMQR